MTIEQLEQGKVIQAQINQLLAHKKSVNNVGTETYKPYLEINSGSNNDFGIKLYDDYLPMDTDTMMRIYNTVIDAKIEKLNQQLKDI